jgi:hypothetical protein
MKSIDVLLQGEAIRDIEAIVVESGAAVRHLLHEAARLRRHHAEGEFFVFAEGQDEPLDHDKPIPGCEPGRPLRMHVHRCRSIATFITFNGQTKEHPFGPATTVAAVKGWAAIKAFHMTPGDAAEHVLQLSGTSTRPEPDTHIGALVSGKECQVRFDLVPSKRVEG